jgi:hypothetical protein
VPAATHRSCCLRWCLLALNRGDGAILVIYGRSARHHGGRSVDTDQSDKQQDGSDGPRHMGLVSVASMPPFRTYRHSTGSPCSKVTGPATPLPSRLPFSTGCYLCSAQLLGGEVIQHLGDFTRVRRLLTSVRAGCLIEEQTSLTGCFSPRQLQAELCVAKYPVPSAVRVGPPYS